MKKFIYSTMFFSFIAIQGMMAQASVSSTKKSAGEVNAIASKPNLNPVAASSATFFEEMKNRLALNEKQVSQIKPLADQMFHDKTELEVSKLSKTEKKNRQAQINQAFDDRMSRLLDKIQFKKYLDWIKTASR